jgi:hypothetical protein
MTDQLDRADIQVNGVAVSVFTGSRMKADRENRLVEKREAKMAKRAARRQWRIDHPDDAFVIDRGWDQQENLRWGE